MSLAYHCDNCDHAPAVHDAKTQHGEGTFCCECAHCSDSDECEGHPDYVEPTDSPEEYDSEEWGRLNGDER